MKNDASNSSIIENNGVSWVRVGYVIALCLPVIILNTLLLLDYLVGQDITMMTLSLSIIVIGSLTI
ncbi:MAG: hypothetical protein COA79_23265 [Planctomycetota bacterium]|nr:MAG: hypothetical protein COA79_23265 [Planctomycetota bacterium]